MKKEYISPAVCSYELRLKSAILTVSDPKGSGNEGGITQGTGSGEESREDNSIKSNNVWSNEW